MTASGLPSALLHTILRAKGRVLFYYLNAGVSLDNDDFFGHITPQASDISGRDRLYRIGADFKALPAQDWSITADGNLLVLCGSQLQLPNYRQVTVHLYGRVGSLEDVNMKTAPVRVSSAFRKWLRKHAWRESISRACELPLISQDPFDDPDMPRDIEVRFLPLAVRREPESYSELHNIAKLTGLGTESNVGVMGIVLASNSRKETGKQKEWYKCGFYVSYGSFTPFQVPEKDGMIVGSCRTCLLI